MRLLNNEVHHVGSMAPNKVPTGLPLFRCSFLGAGKMRVLLLVLALVCGLTISENFHPERTKLIDVYPRSSSPTNFLFRGNMPIVNGSFAYTQIVSNMTTIITAQGFKPPTNFSLIVFSYLNPFEEKDLTTERDFFKKNPSKGEFLNLIVAGSVLAPPQDDPDLIKGLVDEYEKNITFNNLSKLTAMLYDLLSQQQGPALIYTHCEAGTDRTGQASGAYYLRYLNMSFERALYCDNHVQDRDMYTTSRNAMQWYCYYLYYKQGFTNLDCTLPTLHPPLTASDNCSYPYSPTFPTYSGHVDTKTGD